MDYEVQYNPLKVSLVELISSSNGYSVPVTKNRK